MSAVGAALHRTLPQPDFAVPGRSTTLRIVPAIFLLLTLNGVAGGQRLPTSVVPSHYRLFLDPSIESQRFSGEETIDVRLTQATKEIVLNSLDLEISAAEGMAVSSPKIRKRHMITTTRAGVDPMDLSGESIGRQPFGHGVGIQKSPVNLLRRRPEHTMQAHSI